nr:hypothetical protein Q903MT_gene6461 [Picea sitchensis]
MEGGLPLPIAEARKTQWVGSLEELPRIDSQQPPELQRHGWMDGWMVE